MNKINLVLFDMDKTLVLEDTARLWCKFLDEKGILTQEEHRKREKFDRDYCENRLDILAAYQFEFEIMRKIPVVEREHWRTEFFECHVKEKISNKALALIENYKQIPDTLVILITASIAFVAVPVAEHVDFHDLIATEGEVIDNQYTGRLLGIPSIGDGKVKRLKQWMIENNIMPGHTTLYSDSINDLPLLSEVHRPVAVDPDKYLEKIAVERNWEIVSFKDY